MPLHTCTICGRIGPTKRCDSHPARDRQDQEAFRQAVLRRDGYKCRFCPATTDLRAAHWPVPLRALDVSDHPYDPKHGVTVCGPCDRRLDPYAS